MGHKHIPDSKCSSKEKNLTLSGEVGHSWFRTNTPSSLRVIKAAPEPVTYTAWSPVQTLFFQSGLRGNVSCQLHSDPTLTAAAFSPRHFSNDTLRKPTI